MAKGTVDGPRAGRATLGHVPAIEGLRAVAVIAVVAFHLDIGGALRGGFLGVDLFFTLSGFLIARLLLAEHADHGRIRLLGFYDRRFRRLLPAALAMVGVVIVVEDVYGTALTDPLRLDDVRAVLFYVANWHFIATAQDYFATGSAVSPLRHMWSLAVEEQFYIGWPVVVAFVLALGRRLGPTAERWTLGVAAAGLAAASAALFALRYEPGQVSRAYYGTDTRVFQLLVGVVAAVVERDAVARRAERWSRSTRQAVVAVGLLAIGAAFVVVDAEAAPYYYGLGLAFSVVAAIVVYQLSRWPAGGVVAALSWRPVALIGALSYGIYLWHWPFLRWIAIPPDATVLERRMVNGIQVAATVAAAAASYHLLEHPVRTGRIVRRLAVPARLAAMALPVVLLAVVAGRLLGAPASDPILAAVDDRSVTSCPGDRFPCVVADFRVGPDDPTVAVIGDSTGQAFTVGFLAQAEEQRWRVVNAARGACPIGHLLVQYSSREERTANERQVQCFAMHDQVWSDLVARYDPDVYLAATVSDRLPHRTDGVLELAGTDRHLGETKQAMLAAFDQLTVNGAPVVVVDSFPLGYGVDCYEERGSEEACFRPIADDEPNAPYHELLRQIAAERPGVVTIVDLSAEVCRPDGCPLRIDDVVVRYDGTHLTGTMSRRLGALVVDALADALERST